MRKLVIGEQLINAGESKQINFNIARLPSRTSIDTPVFIHRAKEDGPTVLLLAGLHGDEINGIEILRRLVKDTDINLKKGSVISIPIVNIYGFLNYSRALPDGKDINRSFPGSLRGSLAGRVAHFLVEEILPHIDFGMDFHTGGDSRTNYPQIRCVFDEENLAYAEAFGAHFILNAPFRPKSLRKQADLMGHKKVIVYEGGESMRFDEYAIEEGVNGCLRVLQKMGMVENAPRPVKNSIVLNGSSWIRARFAGLFHAFVKSGDFIEKGQVVGEITDPFGDFNASVKAARDGYVIGLNNNPVVNAGDALLHIGVIAPGEKFSSED